MATDALAGCLAAAGNRGGAAERATILRGVGPVNRFPSAGDTPELGPADPELDPGIQPKFSHGRAVGDERPARLDAAQVRGAIGGDLDSRMGPVDGFVVREHDRVGQRPPDRQAAGQVELGDAAIGPRHPEQEAGQRG